MKATVSIPIVEAAAPRTTLAPPNDDSSLPIIMFPRDESEMESRGVARGRTHAAPVLSSQERTIVGPMFGPLRARLHFNQHEGKTAAPFEWRHNVFRAQPASPPRHRHATHFVAGGDAVDEKLLLAADGNDDGMFQTMSDAAADINRQSAVAASPPSCCGWVRALLPLRSPLPHASLFRYYVVEKEFVCYYASHTFVSAMCVFLAALLTLIGIMLFAGERSGVTALQFTLNGIASTTWFACATTMFYLDWRAKRAAAELDSAASEGDVTPRRRYGEERLILGDDVNLVVDNHDSEGGQERDEHKRTTLFYQQGNSPTPPQNHNLKAKLNRRWVLTRDPTSHRQVLRALAEWYEVVAAVSHATSYVFGAANLLHWCSDATYGITPKFDVRAATVNGTAALFETCPEYVTAYGPHLLCRSISQGAALVLLSNSVLLLFVPLRSVFVVPLHMAGMLTFVLVHVLPNSAVPHGLTTHQLTCLLMVLCVQLTIALCAAVARELRSRATFRLHVERHQQSAQVEYLQRQLEFVAHVQLPQDLLSQQTAPQNLSTTSRATESSCSRYRRARASHSNERFTCVPPPMDVALPPGVVGHPSCAVVCLIRVRGFVGWACRSCPSDVVDGIRRSTDVVDRVIEEALREAEREEMAKQRKALTMGGASINSAGNPLQSLTTRDQSCAAPVVVDRPQEHPLAVSSSSVVRRTKAGRGPLTTHRFVVRRTHALGDDLCIAGVPLFTPPPARCDEEATTTTTALPQSSCSAGCTAGEEDPLNYSSSPSIRHAPSEAPTSTLSNANVFTGGDALRSVMIRVAHRCISELSICGPSSMEQFVEHLPWSVEEEEGERAASAVSAEQRLRLRRIRFFPEASVVEGGAGYRLHPVTRNIVAIGPALDRALELLKLRDDRCSPSQEGARGEGRPKRRVGRLIVDGTTSLSDLCYTILVEGAPQKATRALQDHHNHHQRFSSAVCKPRRAATALQPCKQPPVTSKLAPPASCMLGSSSTNPFSAASAIASSCEVDDEDVFQAEHEIDAAHGVARQSSSGSYVVPLSMPKGELLQRLSKEIKHEDETLTGRGPTECVIGLHITCAVFAPAGASNISAQQLSEDSADLSFSRHRRLTSCQSSHSISKTVAEDIQKRIVEEDRTTISPRATDRPCSALCFPGDSERSAMPPNRRSTTCLAAADREHQQQREFSEEMKDLSLVRLLSSGARPSAAEADSGDEGDLCDVAKSRAEYRVRMERRHGFLHVFSDAMTEQLYQENIARCAVSTLDVMVCACGMCASMVALLVVSVLDLTLERQRCLTIVAALSQEPPAKTWTETASWMWPTAAVVACIASVVIYVRSVMGGGTRATHETATELDGEGGHVTDRAQRSSKQQDDGAAVMLLMSPLPKLFFFATIYCAIPGTFLHDNQSLWILMTIDFALIRPVTSGGFWGGFRRDLPMCVPLLVRTMIRNSAGDDKNQGGMDNNVSGFGPLNGRPSTLAVYIAWISIPIVFAIRALTELRRREVFAEAMLLDFQKEELEQDYKNLEKALDRTVPAGGVAEGLVKRMREARILKDDWRDETDAVGAVNDDIVVAERMGGIDDRSPAGPTEGGGVVLHPLWSASGNVHSDDVPIVLLRWIPGPHDDPAVMSWASLFDDISEGIPLHLRRHVQLAQCTRRVAIIAVPDMRSTTDGDDENGDDDDGDIDLVRCQRALELARSIASFYAQKQQRDACQHRGGTNSNNTSVRCALLSILLDFGPAMAALVGRTRGVQFGFYGPPVLSLGSVQESCIRDLRTQLLENGKQRLRTEAGTVMLATDRFLSTALLKDVSTVHCSSVDGDRFGAWQEGGAIPTDIGASHGVPVVIRPEVHARTLIASDNEGAGGAVGWCAVGEDWWGEPLDYNIPKQRFTALALNDSSAMQK